MRLGPVVLGLAAAACASRGDLRGMDVLERVAGAAQAAREPCDPAMSDAIRSVAAMGDDGPEVVVTAPREAAAPREERRVGENGQPEWTTERRFATVRAYVLAPGQVEFEQWMKAHAPRGSGPDDLWQSEIGFGLPGRWQLDLYENYGNDPGREIHHEGVQAETRYALADWGEIPTNPTLYAEYVANHRAPDKVELKALLADELCDPRWHWAVNLFWEHELSGTRAVELGASAGISYALVDSALAVGAEAKFERTSEIRSPGDPRFNPTNELLVGPSIQWRPTRDTHLDFVPLAGLTKSDRRDPRYEIWLVFGWDFGPERDDLRAPTSTRSR